MKALIRRKRKMSSKKEVKKDSRKLAEYKSEVDEITRVNKERIKVTPRSALKSIDALYKAVLGVAKGDIRIDSAEKASLMEHTKKSYTSLKRLRGLQGEEPNTSLRGQVTYVVLLHSASEDFSLTLYCSEVSAVMAFEDALARHNIEGTVVNYRKAPETFLDGTPLKGSFIKEYVIT